MKQKPMQGIPREITDDGELRCLDCGMRPASEFRKQKKTDGRVYLDSRCNGCRRAKLAANNHRIDPVLYRDLMRLAEGRCSICHATGAKLVLDHCHSTGRLRGVVCGTCNMGMAAIDRCPDFGARAAMYIEYWRGVPMSEEERRQAELRVKAAERRAETTAKRKRPTKKLKLRSHWPSVKDTLESRGSEHFR